MSAAKTTRAQARVTTTPNATMTTLASPTQGGSELLSLWRVDMAAGQRGPEHSFDVEQAWHLLEGAATLVLDAQPVDLAPGDTVVVPAGTPRQIGTTSGAVFVVTGPAAGLATPLGDGAGEPVAPAWIR
ncbi:cupin domain-containing protein [Nocardioides daeguensis]|uniref:Cupin type-2 domain-containing protein n=1 Tax=Nocardioides daeguensis TaxID=908359 RepID=A0ABP6VHM5_9ACTN|nr:cupin domain-containing protein [Nocardioides daeguensis]MBV6728975.1 cupin domain-containing protein [Nocardioides daeguensis]MCR1773496.1 cupin domain-containing protein [Nocardioides daeguensis]